jgi:hypothetical protein
MGVLDKVAFVPRIGRSEDCTEDDEDEEEEDGSDGKVESDNEVDGFVVDIQFYVECLMDLIPSMDQVLQQHNST